VTDCTAALKLDENYLKAVLRRAKCFMDLEQYEEAVRDYEKAHSLEKSRGMGHTSSGVHMIFHCN
jgi:DnaJ family protein C protein 7